jgi:hypothetical protein
MSGGIAYVYDPERTFGQRVNLELVDVEPLDGEDSFFVRALVERHGVETDSAVAARLLEHWELEVDASSSRSCRGTTGASSRPPAWPRPRAARWTRPSWRPHMGKPTGFMEFPRSLPRRRPVSVRLRDWREVYEPFSAEQTQEQGARCMDCGIPFCHEGCPLGNLIPEWNDLVYRDDWSDAIERLHATNNFPEFTGRSARPPARRPASSGSTRTR